MKVSEYACVHECMRVIVRVFSCACERVLVRACACAGVRACVCVLAYFSPRESACEGSFGRS